MYHFSNLYWSTTGEKVGSTRTNWVPGQRTTERSWKQALREVGLEKWYGRKEPSVIRGDELALAGKGDPDSNFYFETVRGDLKRCRLSPAAGASIWKKK